MTDATSAILGVSLSLTADSWDWPVHGLRHPPQGDTSGWYLWTGELGQADDFFSPLHAHHLIERWPDLESLLDLPPGTRFLVAPDHRDIWHDESLLDI